MDPPEHENDDSSPARGPHPTLDEAEPVAPRAPVAASPPSAGLATRAPDTPEAGGAPDTPEAGGAADPLDARDATDTRDALGAPDARDAGARDPADTLSPAVRRLVRQYDLDITGIHGTGPAGKIRVGDVIGMLGGRAEQSMRASDAALGAARSNAATASFTTTADEPRETDSPATSSDQSEPTAEAARTAPATTVFECDLSNVLSHRKRERLGDAETLLTSYFAAACSEALRALPELGGGPAAAEPRTAADADTRVAPVLGVLLSTLDGSVRRTLVAASDSESGLDERLRAIDRQLRASGDDDLRAARLLLHHYGPSGSLFATSTPLGEGHAASVGIGRVRREIVIRTVEGEEAPRVAALCFVTLTFLPEHVALERANRFVAELVRVLEQWLPAASA